MKWSSRSILLLLMALNTIAAAPAYSASEFSATICGHAYTETDANAIIQDVFVKKFDELVMSGKLPKSLVERNAGLKFIICDNPRGFDTLSVYGTGVAFDIQLIGLLMAEARALIAGATLNPNDQLTLHRGLMRAFITDGGNVNINPIQQVERDAVAAGMTASQYKTMLEDPKFKQREQTLFLAALNFLSLHERCHFGLDHGSRMQEIRKQPIASQPAERRKLELEADKCAIDIINADEQGFAASPVSYLGLVMIVTTQAIVSAYAVSPETSSHPSSRARIDAAQKEVLQFVAMNQNAQTDKYKATITGVGDYMAGMVDFADAMRISRLNRH